MKIYRIFASNLASKKIRDIQKKGKVPILVGGTGLYFKALIEGLAKIPLTPMKIRKKDLLLIGSSTCHTWKFWKII